MLAQIGPLSGSKNRGHIDIPVQTRQERLSCGAETEKVSHPCRIGVKFDNNCSNDFY